MTGLLVSVRSTEEAEVALAGGADVVDVKEPRRGALGPADPDVWRGVLGVVQRRAVTSAALGELLTDAVERVAHQTVGLRYVKIGLAGCHGRRGWIAKWLNATCRLPRGVQAVPVAYADWPQAEAPSPSVALALAASSPARLLLIDTYQKCGGGLLDCLSLDALRRIAQHATQMRVKLALAGSLDAAAINALRALTPAYIGVRGAACYGGRDGTIDLTRVKSLAALVHSRQKKAAS
jgi:(5-formylfuran-3-yl)methyl phosphate synthase